MKESALKLLLTHVGSERLKKLITKRSIITLTIALGDGKEAHSEASTALSSQRINAKPVFLNSANNKNNSWHINAHFTSSEEAFDITEIGLFISDSEDQQKGSTLLGVYFDEKIIAKKIPKVDLLLDVILNLQAFSGEIVFDRETYQPVFNLSEATTEAYGIVKFADVKAIEEEQAGLALSTDNLRAMIAKFNQDKHSEWKFITTHKLSEDNSYLPMGAAIIGQQVYILFKNEYNESSTLFLFIDYSINSNNIKKNKIKTNQNIVYFNSVSCGIKDQEIRWAVFKDFGISSDNKVYFLKTNIIDQKEENKDSLCCQIAFSKQKERGSLLFYNQKILIMGGDNNLSKQILISSEMNSEARELSLLYARKKPLLHLIQDKIYCIGGNDTTNEALVEIHKLDFSSDKVSQQVFVPEHLINLNFRNTESLTSCVLGNKIYIFNPSEYYQKSKNLFFYIYDPLLNVWHTNMIEKNILEDNVEFKYGKAVSDGYCIYLFCVSKSQNNTDLYILKFTPS